jgi:hypothetical protein
MFFCSGDVPESTQSNKKLVVHVFEKEKVCLIMNMRQ